MKRYTHLKIRHSWILGVLGFGGIPYYKTQNPRAQKTLYPTGKIRVLYQPPSFKGGVRAYGWVVHK
jgi:hypothetical protein